MPADLALKADVVVIGGGLAGIVTALQLLDDGRHVILLDAGREDDFGGLARRAFGGMLLVDTPIQRRNRIPDCAELALRDWESFAEFGDDDVWPRRWAEHYIARCTPDVYEWLARFGIGFFPAAQWPEKGLYVPGNSVPRYHVLWGTAKHMTERLILALREHPNAQRFSLRFGHRVDAFDYQNGDLRACRGRDLTHDLDFCAEAEHFVLASGGITGNLEQVRRHWPPDWPSPPKTLLNGSHPLNDGRLHELVTGIGGRVTHLDQHWNYAAGVHHPQPAFDGHGLSLIPCRSALWMDPTGRRIGPQPLITGFDTRYLCRQASRYPYTWQVLNRRIALKELAISGAEHNPSIRDRKWISFLLEVLLGNHWLVDEMLGSCVDFVSAPDPAGLAAAMNRLTGENRVQAETLAQEIGHYDQRISRPRALHNDDQLRRIAQLRGWTGDRVRTCKFQRINDPQAGPLVAVRLFLITRKTLGGMQTDLSSRVLDNEGRPIENLYAVGEAAGFGGGGISGKRSLEGHCLPACILTAQAAARAIRANEPVAPAMEQPVFATGRLA